MDQDPYRINSLSSSSSSSAVDLTRKAPGIPPPSPSLEAQVARKRTSWGRVDAGADPLQFDPVEPRRLPASAGAAYPVTDNPFYSDDSLPRQPYTTSLSSYYGQPHHEFNPYSTGLPGPSSASLMTSHDMDGNREDDEAHLTGNMSRSGSDYDDPERSPATSNRRRTIRYSTSPSPLKKTGTAIKSVSNNLRRVSLRVVNLAGSGLDNRVRLPEDEARKRPPEEEDQVVVDNDPSPIRGRTLGFLGPHNPLRLALYKFLIYPWTEPFILLLIVANAVILTIQSARSLTLPDEDSVPPRIKGYFQTWEDSALFVLFIIFTLEAFARISVSGFLFDPEIPTASILRSFSFSTDKASNISRQDSTLQRGFSITDRFRTFNQNISRPFTLSSTTSTVVYPGTSHDRSANASTSTIATAGSSKFTEKSASKISLHAREPSGKSHFRQASQPFAPVAKSKTFALGRNDYVTLPFQLSIDENMDKVQRNVPYLRHSWSRIDMVAILSFWAMFALATTGLERGQHHIGLFRAMSVVRTARLLAVTSGTTTIMRSLKTARPLLASVAYFVVFAIAIFSIIGVQSFQGSLRRTCHISAVLGEDEMSIGEQFCGGYIDPITKSVVGFISQDGTQTNASKGYICPLGQTCREGDNPNSDITSFDTTYSAALQVVIIAGVSGWAPLMYQMIDAEFFLSCFFFIICLIILNYWLINLFVAVITNTFSAIRSETKKSAFGASIVEPIADVQDDGWPATQARRPSTRTNVFKVIMDYTKWFWVLLALSSLTIQAFHDEGNTSKFAGYMYYAELGITCAFDLEIIIRVLASLPDWREFFVKPNNLLDLFLAVTCSVIQIPVIQESQVYPWLTVFQLIRFYRVILEVPRMRPLLLAVFGNMYGLFNMTLFLLLVNYLSALVAVQLLRGDMQESEAMNFGQLYTSFLGVYQVFSSEDWPNLMYSAAGSQVELGQTVIIVLFLTCWMLFANFIVLQMFIAVINENFDVAEEAKKGKQATNYWAKQQVEVGKASWFRKFNPYRWVRANPVKVKVENLPSNLVLPMQKALVQDQLAPKREASTPDRPGAPARSKHYPTKSLTTLQRLFTGPVVNNDVPLINLRQHLRTEPSGSEADPYNEQTERHLELLASVNPENPTTNEDMSDILYEQRALKADFIRDHPSFDKTFWIFSQKNALRRWCQTLVQPANGERIFGTPPSMYGHPIFQFIIFLAVAGGIAVESIATPMYRRTFYAEQGLFRGAWFDVAEASFGLTLVVEFLIKVVADGFMFTPNAYILSIWNILDFIIMAGLLVNVSTSLIFIGGLSRLTRSLKALRALRLITLMHIMRVTFESLLISGASRILDAAVLAILYMIPYAVWGLNIFSGKMKACNDEDVTGLQECVNEYTNTVYGNSFGFPVPRVWDDPSPSTTFSFDSFRSSLLILFEIVSLEGWIDVLKAATSITGQDLQPRTNAALGNAIFFVIYNLLGAVVILTLFVSIIIGNFSSKTGSAFLTKPQREWIDLQKLFKRQRPSKRPRIRPISAIRSWCFDRAVNKHGWWSRGMTVLIVIHIIALMTQTYHTQDVADTLRNSFFLAITFIYIIDVIIRLFGLGWTSFRANGWNLFDIIVASGSFVTTLFVRFYPDSSNQYVLEQTQKLFLVSIAFKLVQRTNNLNKLFKTAVASLPVILSLLGLWLILFLFFAILFMEVFGLTKWSTGSTHNINYSSIGSSLVMLAFMSTGEAWNAYMHSYSISYPRCTNTSAADTDSDCGSTEWAFTLFITWNLLSMYIFVNMFTGVVVENFSYVFQASGGGSKSVTREQMRAFKKIWREYANPKTGYLERAHFVEYLSKLSGIFEVRIYPVEHSIPNIVAASQYRPESDWVTGFVVAGINVSKLKENLDQIDFAASRKRRAVYMRLYYEASLINQEAQGRGISFTEMLLLLAHHKIIVDKEALNLKDLVARSDKNKLVTDLVNLDRVQSLLRTISHRRRFLAYMEEKRRASVANQSVPDIVVEPMPQTPPTSSRDISSAGYDNSAPSSPSPADRRFNIADVSLSIDTSGPGLQRSSRRTSEFSMLSTDLGFRTPRDSMMDDDPQNLLASMQSSMWGDMMSEAIEEEDKNQS